MAFQKMDAKGVSFDCLLHVSRSTPFLPLKKSLGDQDLYFTPDLKAFRAVETITLLLLKDQH